MVKSISKTYVGGVKTSRKFRVPGVFKGPLLAMGYGVRELIEGANKGMKIPNIPKSDLPGYVGADQIDPLSRYKFQDELGEENDLENTRKEMDKEYERMAELAQPGNYGSVPRTPHSNKDIPKNKKKLRKEKKRRLRSARKDPDPRVTPPPIYGGMQCLVSGGRKRTKRKTKRKTNKKKKSKKRTKRK